MAEDLAHHTLSVLVENKAGVLARIVNLFSRRAYNIYSLAVAPTDDERPGPLCSCGVPGHTEAWLSGPSLAADYGRATGADPSEVRSQEIVARAEAGEAAAEAALRRFEDRLGRSLALIVNVIDPDVIVLGGGLSNVARFYETVPPRIEAHVFGELSRFGLGHGAEREAQVIVLFLGGGKEEIALVAFAVDRTKQGAVARIVRQGNGLGADIVAGRQRIGAEFLGRGQEIGELDGLVAGDAGDRRLAGDIAFHERVDDRVAEALLVVEHVMGNAERFADAARIVDVLAGAAGAGAVDGGAMIVELQRDAEDVIAFALQQPGHDGGVDPARHGDDDARIFRLLVKIQRVHGLFRQSDVFQGEVRDALLPSPACWYGIGAYCSPSTVQAST